MSSRSFKIDLSRGRRLQWSCNVWTPDRRFEVQEVILTTSPKLPKVHSTRRNFRLESSCLLGSWHRNPRADRLLHLSELSAGSLLLAGAYQKRMRATSNFNQNAAPPGFSANGVTTIDVGLRAFMLQVYDYMAAGVGLTGVAAFMAYQFTEP
jgi:hypothetical protein